MATNKNLTRKRYNRIAFCYNLMDAPLGIFFDVLNPFVVRMMGANINRRTIDNIKMAGWQIQTEKKLSSDIVWLIEAAP